MEILHAEIDDAPDILALQKLAYHTEAVLYDNFEIPPLTQTIEDLIAQFDDHTFLKVVNSSQIIGSVRAMCQGDTCYIGRLIVHPDFQNQGIGTRLLCEIENTGMPNDMNCLLDQRVSEPFIFIRNLAIASFALKQKRTS